MERNMETKESFNVDDNDNVDAEPVSYTHLDVYKRQVLMREW